MENSRICYSRVCDSSGCLTSTVLPVLGIEFVAQVKDVKLTHLMKQKKNFMHHNVSITSNGMMMYTLRTSCYWFSGSLCKTVALLSQTLEKSQAERKSRVCLNLKSCEGRSILFIQGLTQQNKTKTKRIEGKENLSNTLFLFVCLQPK